MSRWSDGAGSDRVADMRRDPVFPLPRALDLISTDPVVRRAALACHEATERRRADAQARYDALCAQAPTMARDAGRTRPSPVTELDAAEVELRQAGQASFLGCVRAWPEGERAAEGGGIGTEDWDRDPARFLPYVLVFLEWEARFPDDWPRHWLTKSTVLRELGRRALPADARDRLVELVDAAIRRSHRCEDQQYALAARAADGPELRLRLDRAGADPDALVRSRARFTRFVLDQPVPVRRIRGRHWTRWLRDGDLSG